jgi:hypothetical protein
MRVLDGPHEQGFCREQAFDGDVLVHVLPMEANSTTDEPPPPALLGRSLLKAWEPCQRHRYLPAIGHKTTRSASSVQVASTASGSTLTLKVLMPFLLEKRPVLFHDTLNL